MPLLKSIDLQTPSPPPAPQGLDRTQSSILKKGLNINIYFKCKNTNHTFQVVTITNLHI